MRRGRKKDLRKVEKLEKHAGSMKFGKTLRLFEAHLGIFSGLVDQGLVARCFRVLQSHFKVGSKRGFVARCVRVLQYQLSSTITCQKEKERQSRTLQNLSLFVTRQQMQVAMPNWVAVREERAAQFLSYDYQ